MSATPRRTVPRGRSGRPYVICHMVPSVDGRIVTRSWPVPGSLISSEYERTAATLGGDAWIIGRVSMEPYAGNARLPPRSGRSRIPRSDFIAREDATSHAIAIDPSGKLRWTSGSVDDDHAVAVLTERVSDRYLEFLRDRGVSYLFGGRDRIDLAAVLRKIRQRLGVRRLLLEGGGRINGSFLAADCIDEVSLLPAPVADGSIGTPTPLRRDGRGVCGAATAARVGAASARRPAVGALPRAARAARAALRRRK